MNVSRLGLLIATMPGTILLVLFYSLAVHMYWLLDGWPTSIGNARWAVRALNGRKKTWHAKTV
jgi:hypothetical protein